MKQNIFLHLSLPAIIHSLSHKILFILRTRITYSNQIFRPSKGDQRQIICRLLDGRAAINNIGISAHQVNRGCAASQDGSRHVLPSPSGESNGPCDQNDSIPLKPPMNGKVSIHQQQAAS